MTMWTIYGRNRRRLVDVHQMGRLMAMQNGVRTHQDVIQGDCNGKRGDGDTQQALNRSKTAYSVLRSETSVGANRR